jgi:hypothetical protein
MTRHTDAEQERASLGAFIDRAGRDGFDTAHTFFDCGEVVFLNPDTADLWGFWQAARRAPAAPVPQGWKLVPEESTEAMARAFRADDAPGYFCMTTLRCADFSERYVAMLAAAPQPPANET